MPGAVIIDGKAIAEEIRREITAEVSALRAAHDGKSPGLAAVICGDRKDSQTYVRLKRKAAAECGFVSFPVELPADVTQAVLEAELARLSALPTCHGVLLQLPLPPHLDARAAIARIAPSKDADALLPVSVGLLHADGRAAPFLPCTPAAVVELLRRGGVPVAGRRAVVLGRSQIVGAPTAALLTRHDATVTLVHSATPPADAEAFVRGADIVVSAMGRPRAVPGEWIKEGAAVIDVGTTPVEDATKKAGYRLVGDVCFEEAKERAGFITPVPGGVGPMTIAMLLRNTLESFKRSLAESEAER